MTETITPIITFSNPRLRADFDDWPSGRARVKCVFIVHRDKRGWRVERRTTDKNGQWCKPKFTTYSGQAAIVDGSDGRTYILQVAHGCGFITVIAHDFRNCDPKKLNRHTAAIFQQNETDKALHEELAALILAGGAFNQPME